MLKEKEREFRQKLIIDAARNVFEKKTYNNVSMVEIAKVGVFTGSLISMTLGLTLLRFGPK